MMYAVMKKIFSFFSYHFPKLYFRFVSTFYDVSKEKLDAAKFLFDNTQRIDIFPSDSREGRGFTLVLDNKLCLFFEQLDDCFRYSGMEMGTYKKGNVTIFDSLPKEKKGQEFRDFSENSDAPH